jgi:hypothetical protein
MADAQPLIVRNTIDPVDFLALATPDGGEIIDADTLRRQFEANRWDALENLAGNLVGAVSPASPPAPSAETPAAATAVQSPAMLSPTMQNEREKKLKEIVLAMQNHHDVFRRFPIAERAEYFDAEGKPNVSWRVHLLQFLDQAPLARQFKLDEPWDSPHNIALLDKMPDVFRDPTDPIGGTKTRFVTFTGPNTPFSGQYGPRFTDIRDGTSMTLLVVTCGADKAVPWTKPEDIVFDPNSPVGCLGQLEGPGIFFARADGAVKVLKHDVPPEWFQAFVTPAGQESTPSGLKDYQLR